MKKQWTMVGAIVLLLIAVIFSWMNSQAVTVNFGFTKVTMPLVVILVISILIGALIVVLLSTSANWKQKREIKSLKKQLAANKAMKRQPENENSEVSLQQETQKEDSTNQNLKQHEE